MFFIKSVTFCVIRFNLGIEYLVKAMDFYCMGKNMGKNINKNLSGIARSVLQWYYINIVLLHDQINFLIVLKNQD